jgi:hypothetical protein
MIPEIGFMVGAYILVRMFDLLGRSDDPSRGGKIFSGFLKISALGTILITLFVMLDLLLRGTTGVNVNDLK